MKHHRITIKYHQTPIIKQKHDIPLSHTHQTHHYPSIVPAATRRIQGITEDDMVVEALAAISDHCFSNDPPMTWCLISV